MIANSSKVYLIIPPISDRKHIHEGCHSDDLGSHPNANGIRCPEMLLYDLLFGAGKVEKVKNARSILQMMDSNTSAMERV